MDVIDGIIVGAAAAAIGAIVADKFINRTPQGGGAPNQPEFGASPEFGRPRVLYAVDLTSASMSHAAPVAGYTTPQVEAAFNVYPVEFVNAFGPAVEHPGDEAVLPA